MFLYAGGGVGLSGLVVRGVSCGGDACCCLRLLLLDAEPAVSLWGRGLGDNNWSNGYSHISWTWAWSALIKTFIEWNLTEYKPNWAWFITTILTMKALDPDLRAPSFKLLGSCFFNQADSQLNKVHQHHLLYCSWVHWKPLHTAQASIAHFILQVIFCKTFNKITNESCLPLDWVSWITWLKNLKIFIFIILLSFILITSKILCSQFCTQP